MYVCMYACIYLKFCVRSVSLIGWGYCTLHSCYRRLPADSRDSSGPGGRQGD